MTRKVKVGLVGTGKISQIYAENFAFRIPEAELVAVSDPFVEAAEKYTTDYLIPTAYNHHHSLLSYNSFETVPTCLNTNTHLQFIMRKPGSTNSNSFPPFYCWEQERPLAPTIFM